MQSGHPDYSSGHPDCVGDFQVSQSNIPLAIPINRYIYTPEILAQSNQRKKEKKKKLSEAILSPNCLENTTAIKEYV